MAAATDEVVFAVEQVGALGADSQVAPRLVAMKSADGAILWQLDLAPVAPATPAGPFVGAGVAVVNIESAGGRAVAGIEPTTGQIQWRHPLDGGATAIVATDGIVVINSVSPPADWIPPTLDPSAPPLADSSFGFYNALDRSSGAPLWSLEVTASADSLGDPSLGDGRSRHRLRAGGSDCHRRSFWH